MTEIESHRRTYARPEWERRFFVSALPAKPSAVRVRRIVDRYLTGTRLRLRVMTDAIAGEPHEICKLTQKIPPPESAPSQGLITNTYLSRAEFDVLSALPASALTKTRHSIPPMGIDVFDPPLDGLIIAEAEFDSEDAMTAFAPPPYVTAEVTDDPRFTGGQLGAPSGPMSCSGCPSTVSRPSQLCLVRTYR